MFLIRIKRQVRQCRAILILNLDLFGLAHGNLYKHTWLNLAKKCCENARYARLQSSPGWTPFCLQTCLNSLWHILNSTYANNTTNLSTRGWKHCSEILVHIDMIASRSCCKSPVPPHPKGALLDWDLVTVEAIWVKWTHCHVPETSLRWFELCNMMHYPAGNSIRRWVHCSHKGMDMVSNNTQVGCGV